MMSGKEFPISRCGVLCLALQQSTLSAGSLRGRRWSPAGSKSIDLTLGLPQHLREENGAKRWPGTFKEQMRVQPAAVAAAHLDWQGACTGLQLFWA